MPSGALNLTLYTTRAVIVLDSEGHRLVAKYYEPLATREQAPAPPAVPPGLAPLVARNPYGTLKQQRTFEQGIWDKARRASGDLFQYDGHLVLFKASYDVFLFVVAPDRENELMIHSFLQSLYDTLTILLQSQIDKRMVLDNLDLVSIAIDESVDDGYVPRPRFSPPLADPQHHPRDGQRGHREPRDTHAPRHDRGPAHRAEYVRKSLTQPS